MLVCLFWAVLSVCRLVGQYRYSTGAALNAAPMLYFITSTLLYTCHSLYFAGYGNRILEVLYIMANLSVFPLFWLYLRNLVRQSRWSAVVLLLPALSVGVLLALCSALGWETGYGVIRMVARFFFAAQVLFVWISGSLMIRDFRNRLILPPFQTADRNHSPRIPYQQYWFLCQ